MAGARALAPGSRLGEYEIERVLEEGSADILYAAHDHGLQRRVALREYLPGTLAARGQDGAVLPQAGVQGEMFALGLRAFAHEARLLARCDHPALAKVLRYWEASHTGYMAMRWSEGESLQAWREALRQPPGEIALRALLVDLLGALEALHAAFAQHREIVPGNILLQPDGRPVLLGFHAARRLLTERGLLPGDRELTAWAPLEAHPEGSHLQQGPWSDLYSLAAVAYFCVTGKPPPSATVRMEGGVTRPLSAAVREAGSRHAGLQYSPAFLAALDWGFELQPQARPRSAAEWRAVLLQAGAATRATGASGTDGHRRPGIEADRAVGAAVLHWRLPDTGPVPVRPSPAGRPLAQAGAAPEGASLPPASAPASMPPESFAREPRHGAAAEAERGAEPSTEAVRAAVAAALDSLPPPRRDDAFDLAVRRPAGAVSSPRGTPRRWLWPVVGVLGLMAGAAGWQWKEQRDTLKLTQAIAGASPSALGFVSADAASPPSPASVPVADVVEQTRAQAPGTAPAFDLPGGEARDAQGGESASPPLPPVVEDPPSPTVEQVPAVPASPQASVPVPAASPAPVTPAAATPAPAAASPAPVKDGKRAASGNAASAAAERSASKTPVPVQFKSPREACAPRQRFSLYYCMQQQCEKPQFRPHRQCEALRERDEIE